MNNMNSDKEKLNYKKSKESRYDKKDYDGCNEIEDEEKYYKTVR